MTNVYRGYKATAEEFRSITAITHGARTTAPATQSIPGQLTIAITLTLDIALVTKSFTLTYRTCTDKSSKTKLPPKPLASPRSSSNPCNIPWDSPCSIS